MEISESQHKKIYLSIYLSQIICIYICIYLSIDRSELWKNKTEKLIINDKERK